jgi:hypothetical protein
MRKALLAVVATAVILPMPVAAEDDRPQALVDRFVRAWNAHDPKAMGDLFTDEADFVNAEGVWSQGRPWIRAQLERFHTTKFKGTTLVETNTRCAWCATTWPSCTSSGRCRGRWTPTASRPPSVTASCRSWRCRRSTAGGAFSAQDTQVPPPV